MSRWRKDAGPTSNLSFLGVCVWGGGSRADGNIVELTMLRIYKDRGYCTGTKCLSRTDQRDKLKRETEQKCKYSNKL